MKLFEKAKEPKDLVVHDSGHELPIERAMSETVAWMKKRLPSLLSGAQNRGFGEAPKGAVHSAL